MTYVVPDEPQPEHLADLVVRPSGPLLASMLCGAWLAWPWFAVNTIAMGSPTRRTELRLIGVAIAGTVALTWVLWLLLTHRVIDSELELQLGLLAIATWKLGLAYRICTVQGRVFAVFEASGRAVRTAIPVLIAGYWLKPVVLGLSPDPRWIIIVSGGL